MSSPFIDRILLSRFLEEMSTNETTTYENATGYNDGNALRNTIGIYGGALVFIILLYSWLRRAYPHVYNVRSWAKSCKTFLADERFPRLTWMWRVYMVTDDEIMQECGLDACCFVRLIQMGYRMSLVGIFNMLWLLPVYKTAEESAETADITDPIVQTTVANVSAGSDRLFATVIAAYILFGYAMYLILQEFDWYIEMRHKFLSRAKPEHYSVFVRNIPPSLCDNESLVAFFRDCFSEDAVLEAKLAINAPSLASLVAKRQATLAALEHALALYQQTGVRPQHKEQLLGLTGDLVDSIECYTQRLQEQNQIVAEKITIYESVVQGVKRTRSVAQRITVHQSVVLGGRRPPRSGSSFGASLSATLPADPYSEQEDEVPFLQSLASGKASVDVEQTSNTSDITMNVEGTADLATVNNGNNFTATLGKSVNMATQGVGIASKYATHAIKASANTVTSAAGKGIQDLSRIITGGEDGSVKSAGFVVFSKLSTTNAALQMIHHSTPFSMEMLEATDPKDVYWGNIGRTHKDLELGKLGSLALATGLCLLWTIPMSFFASLANVNAVREDVQALDDFFTKYPGCVVVVEQLAPLLVVMFNGLLPTILEKISALEGPISLGILQASKFVKLAAFAIIQTFFVSAISGSVIQAISDIIEDWTKVIDLLANSLPAQGTYFMQILLVSTAMSAGMELLRVSPVIMAFMRRRIGPNLTEKERNTTFMGLRPFSDPEEFGHADFASQLVIYFMVLFVYAVISPITPLICAVCFAFMGAMFRNQFIYIYPKNPDSGGKLWANFVQILLTCMMIAQITIVGLLGLKKGVIQLPLFLPLLYITFLFNVYIRQKHFKVAAYLPTRECVKADKKREYEGGGHSFVIGAYTQPEMAAKAPLSPDPSLLQELERATSSYESRRGVALLPCSSSSTCPSPPKPSSSKSCVGARRVTLYETNH